MTAALAALAALIPTPATETPINPDCAPGLERAYTKHYQQVRQRHGQRAPGRQIRKLGIRYDTRPDGQRGPWKIRPAKCHELRQSNQQLKALLYDPPAMTSKAVPPPQAPAGVQTDTDQANLPDCTWRPESGGDYSAVNPSSGAYGKYQIIPSTWAAHCAGISRTPSGQEQCAARVYRAQGAGAWVGC
jgi:hypothetical protein